MLQYHSVRGGSFYGRYGEVGTTHHTSLDLSDVRDRMVLLSGVSLRTSSRAG